MAAAREGGRFFLPMPRLLEAIPNGGGATAFDAADVRAIEIEPAGKGFARIKIGLNGGVVICFEYVPHVGAIVDALHKRLSGIYPEFANHVIDAGKHFE